MQAREKKIQKMNREIEPRREKMSEGKGEREGQIDRQRERERERERETERILGKSCKQYSEVGNTSYLLYTP